VPKEELAALTGKYQSVDGIVEIFDRDGSCIFELRG